VVQLPALPPEDEGAGAAEAAGQGHAPDPLAGHLKVPEDLPLPPTRLTLRKQEEKFWK
jgi:hypothetical protein